MFKDADQERAGYIRRFQAMKVTILVLLCLVVLASCAPGGAAVEFYVVLKPRDTTKLITAIKSTAAEEGMETAEGRTRFDSANTLRFVEGRGHGLKLWAQNTILTGNEDPKLCGAHHEPYPDPSQFNVFTVPRFLGSATELGERVFSKLHTRGFDVLRKPALCGAAVSHDRA